MPRNPAVALDESALTKGELRKLNALRKSVGEEIGDMAFVEWHVLHRVAPEGQLLQGVGRAGVCSRKSGSKEASLNKAYD